MSTTGVDDTTCCYAFKTEAWVNDPDGASCEVYVKTGDAEQMAANADPDAAADQCCSPADSSDTVVAGISPEASRRGTALRCELAQPPGGRTGRREAAAPAEQAGRGDDHAPRWPRS